MGQSVGSAAGFCPALQGEEIGGFGRFDLAFYPRSAEWKLGGGAKARPRKRLSKKYAVLGLRTRTTVYLKRILYWKSTPT